MRIWKEAKHTINILIIQGGRESGYASEKKKKMVILTANEKGSMKNNKNQVKQR